MHVHVIRAEPSGAEARALLEKANSDLFPGPGEGDVVAPAARPTGAAYARVRAGFREAARRDPGADATPDFAVRVPARRAVACGGAAGCVRAWGVNGGRGAAWGASSQEMSCTRSSHLR